MTSLTVIDAFPPFSIEQRPLCTAQLSRHVVEVRRVWVARKDPPRRIKEHLERGAALEECGCNARYKINGKYYCRKHGALVALDLVAEKVKP